MLGEQVREYRGKHGLSMQAMAELCGCSKLTIMKIEAGEQKPTASTEYKIKEVLKNEAI